MRSGSHGVRRPALLLSALGSSLLANSMTTSTAPPPPTKAQLVDSYGTHVRADTDSMPPISLSMKGTTGTTSVPSTSASPRGGVVDASGAPQVQQLPTTTQVSTLLSVTSSVGKSITASGTTLLLGGRPYKFVGVNAYEITTDWGVNGSCGTMVDDAQLADLFSSLPPNSLVRFWAWQGSTATNIHTQQIDWAPLDRIFSTAAHYHQRLIVVLAGQSGTCDDGVWKDPSWYESGFMQVHDANGLTPLSYWTYVKDVVARYKDSPALGMWEPISEAEASTCPTQYEPSDCGGHQICPDESQAVTSMRHFFDVVGAEIHSLDPQHLVESGTIGSGQCGTSGSDYETVSNSPGIDVLSYHDYDGSVALGGDQWNGLALRFSEAADIGKPIIGGEVGISAGTSFGCTSLIERANQFEAKEQAQINAGSSGLLVWNWEPTPPTGCAFDTYPGDPLMQILRQGLSS
jgi:mannan endo-1,4-beta-mannosidase